MPHSVPSEGSDPQKDPTPPEGGWQAIRKWFEKNRSQVLFFLGGLALYLLLGLFLWWLLQLYVDPSTIKDPSKEATAKKDLLQALAFIMAGVAGAIGIYFTWRGQRLTQESTQEELRITREGQITERFTRAIDQLGKVDDKGKKLFEIRVGGIYALERIARESEEDYWPIMEILTAYVRQNAPLLPEAGQESTEDATDEERAMEGFGEESEIAERSAPDPDIQAIMTILRRRTRSYDQGEPEPLDLHDTNLSRANLQDANLRDANLSGTKLSGADLRKANLFGAKLPGADLSRARVSGANLLGADLQGADLSGANLYVARLIGANLSEADLSAASLSEANLFGADLSGANLQMANLWLANLTRANLSEANLSEANLSEAKFSGAGLSHPSPETSYSEEDFLGADLSGADLSGADLSGAEYLNPGQLEQTLGDENTRLPSELKPPAHWNVKIDGN
jgi:uncharacterized protein YjbI with pentapeptide repeats